MRHLRADYNAIQPWPTKRPHIVRTRHGELAEATGSEEAVAVMVAAAGLTPIIPDDEPVFLLRSKDKLAPGIVRRWAEQLEESGGDPELVEAVMGFAAEMQSYAETNYGGGKIPDVPEGSLFQ